MALRIETFDNIRGGNTLYKALTYPHAAGPGRALVAALAARPTTAIVDPLGGAEGFAEIFGLADIDIAGIYVQDVARLGGTVLGQQATPIDRLVDSGARSVLVVAFDAERLIAQLRPYLPAETQVLSLDAMRIPEERLTNRRTYLDPLNFATNFALFRDTGTLHTRIVTVNYWAGYGSSEIACWLTLFDGDGAVIAEWCERGGPQAAALTIDSRQVRQQFGLVDVAELLPDVAWPRQIELRAGKHVVRPRYEIIADRHRRIAHVNVERADLKPNPELPELGKVLGKGYLLPAPILPRNEWRSLVLPTPMAVSQGELPIAAIVYDPTGTEVARHPFGRLP